MEEPTASAGGIPSFASAGAVPEMDEPTASAGGIPSFASAGAVPEMEEPTASAGGIPSFASAGAVPEMDEPTASAGGIPSFASAGEVDDEIFENSLTNSPFFLKSSIAPQFVEEMIAGVSPITAVFALTTMFASVTAYHFYKKSRRT